MKTIVGTTFLILLFMLLSNIGYADQFQLVDRASQSYIAYSPFQVSGVKEYTDKYGRLIINLPMGQYSGVVRYRGRDRSVTLKVDGRRSLKVIYVD